MTLLSTYETDVADLLHDPNQQFWSLAQLDRYINDARKRLVMDTGCLRTYQTAFTTAGTEAYSFGTVTGASITAGGSNYSAPTVSFTGGGGSGVAATLGITAGAVTSITFTSLGSGYTSAPTAVISDGTGSGAAITVGVINVNTYDILDCYIINGNMRYPLRWKPFSSLSATLRQWNNYKTQPAAWAIYGQAQIYVGPIPDQTYQLDMDTCILPTPLADYVTNDNIPAIYQGPIKYYAAYLAKENNQSFGEAQAFLAQYQRTLLQDIASYTRRVPNLYADPLSRGV